MARLTEEKDRILKRYEQLQDAMDLETARLRARLGRSPCAATCYDCCRNTSTLLIGRVEALDIQRALRDLPDEVRSHIRRKATRTVRKLESLGYQRERDAQLSTRMIRDIRGTEDAECPMLIGGVCAIYERRPVICRLWGYPITNNGSVTCCRKTFIGMRDLVKPIDYDSYWAATHDLNIALGEAEKTPNCYMVLDFLDGLK